MKNGILSKDSQERGKNRFSKILSKLDETIVLVGANVHTALSGKKGPKNLHKPVDSNKIEKDFWKATTSGDAKLLQLEGHFITLSFKNLRKYKNVLTELGRRREETFREAGEGTGKSVDLDKYDNFYHHIILWDTEKQNIAGAYRVGVGDELIGHKGPKGLYTSTLFDYPEDFVREYLVNGFELGRSFVAKEYREGRETLDRLWKGIATFVVKRQEKNPNLRYFYGPVSMSEHVSEREKSLLIRFCEQYLGGETFNDSILDEVRGKVPFEVTEKLEEDIAMFFSELENVPENKRFRKSFAALMSEFKKANSHFPVLFFLYAELCGNDFFKYLAFHRDKKFGSVDGLLLLDTEGITPNAREKFGLIPRK